MTTPSGTVSAPIVRSSFLPELWHKGSTVEKGLAATFLALIGAVFLYTLYKAVNGSSEASDSSFVERRAVSLSGEKVGCIIRIARECLVYGNEAKVTIDQDGQTLAVRHVTLGGLDSYADIFCLLPKDERVQITINYPTPLSRSALHTAQPLKKLFKVHEPALCVINRSLQFSDVEFTPLRQSNSPKSWTPRWTPGVSPSSQDGLVPMRFVLGSDNKVYPEWTDKTDSLSFEDHTNHYQVVDISLEVKGDSSEIDPLSVLAALDVKNIPFEQIFKDWSEAYTLKTGLTHTASSLNASHFKIKRITLTPYAATSF